MASKIRQAAFRFRKEYKIKRLSYARLAEIIRSQGFKIIRYGRAYNDESVEVLINALELGGYIRAYSAFTYADSRYRLVFLADNISEEEALFLLAHEEGHIYNGHLGKAVITGKSITDEYEANEFAHYILGPTAGEFISGFFTQHKVLLIVAGIIAVLAVCSAVISPNVLRRQAAAGSYYATPSGEKYHRAECIMIRDKSTKKQVSGEEIQKRKLEPCKICLPELNKN